MCKGVNDRKLFNSGITSLHIAKYMFLKFLGGGGASWVTAGGKSRCSSPPQKKNLLYGGGGAFAIFSPRGGLSVTGGGGGGLAFPRLEAFLIYLIYVGAFMLHFLPCGGLFAIFSLCRSPFLSLWGVFLGLIAPPSAPPLQNLLRAFMGRGRGW